nr:MAG TPA: hypothetical protein [Caudoviricetes sp.]
MAFFVLEIYYAKVINSACIHDTHIVIYIHRNETTKGTRK